MHWYLLTLVGRDQAGIVAQVTEVLYRHGANLGETSMVRLGGNFTVMVMVEYAGDVALLQQALEPVAAALHLRFHLDPLALHHYERLEPEVTITLHGADRAGIVARVTALLAAAGLNILDMQSSVMTVEGIPIYLMQIEGTAAQGVEPLQQAMTQIRTEGITAHCCEVETLLG